MMHPMTAFPGAQWSLPLALQGGPDSPFGDVLGYIIVFFVIVWPILRGIIESARGERKEFEAKQGQGKPAAPRPARRKRTLEEILEGKLERADIDVAPRPVQPAIPLKPPVSRAPAPKVQAPAARFGERPVDESSAPVYRADDLYGGDPYEDLVGDPFDEASMEQDLVPDARLRHISSEDEVEAGGASIGTQARGETARSVEERAQRAIRRATPVALESTQIRDDPEVLFRRLPRPLTPWQKAVVLREVLSPPLATRPSPTLTDLPD